MTYGYRCPKCGATFDVIKPVKDMDVNEYCPRCDEPSTREFLPQRIHLSKTAVQNAEYNPGLGCVVKNRYDASEVAKRKDLVEVGNDFRSGESMQKQFDTAREEKLKKRYEEI